MADLSLALQRVDSGLVIELHGYEALTFEIGGKWAVKTDKVRKQQREDLVSQFAKAVKTTTFDEFPKAVVQPSPGQPVTITALEHQSGRPAGTRVISSSSRTGLVPHVDRLAEKILEERKHLPDSPASLILVDLVRWRDFQDAAYYLRQTAAAIDDRIGPSVLVGTFVGAAAERGYRLNERGTLAYDSAWATSELGQHLRRVWAGSDHTLRVGESVVDSD